MEQLLFFATLSLFLLAISGFTALGAIVGSSPMFFTKQVIVGITLATPKDNITKSLYSGLWSTGLGLRDVTSRNGI